MTMITKPLFLTRLVLFAGLALILVAAFPASASNPGLQNNLGSPARWPAFHPPSVDILAIVVTPSGDLTTTEAAVTATISIVLDIAPSDDVTIPVSSNDLTEGAVSPDQLVFTPENYASPQDITITGQNDDVADGNIGYTVEVGPATSTDPAYSGADPADIDLINTDNDTANVTVNPTSGLTTTEATGDVEPTFTVVLTSQPTADVTIGISSSNTAEGTVAPASLTFTAANWSTSQTVSVTGVDDLIDDGDITYTINTANPTGSDTTYNLIDPADVPVTNIDNDTAGITVSDISGPTTEAGGQATFTVVLNTKPTGNVTIGLSSDNTAEGTVSPESLTFTAGNWDSPQSATAIGVNDDVVDGDIPYNIITANPTGSDPVYNTLDPANVSVTNIDDDIAGITVSAISGPTTEAGGTATFTVVLDTLPGDNVSLGLTSLDTGEGTVSPDTLTFTPANYSGPQTVTITGVNDDVDDGNINYTIETSAATSTDPAYNNLDADEVSVTNNDDDTAGILLTPNAGLITTEAGGIATFTVQLTSQPTADVILGLSSSDVSEGDVAPTSMTFTTANWDSPKTATVTGKNDQKRDGPIDYQINVSVSSSDDTLYAALPPVPAGVTNTDDDTSGITVTPITGLITTEAGGTASFSVVLNTEPEDTVTIDVASDNVNEGTLEITNVTFTTVNWNIAQDVTITGVNDDVDDGDVAYNIITAAAVSAGDPIYDGIDPDDVSVANTDNDEAGFTITPSAGLVTTETGGSASFEVKLRSQPTTDVFLNLGSDDPTEGTASPTTLTFTAANWDEPQTVTIVGVDDDQIDGDIPYKIVTEPVISDDLKYKDRNPTDVSVTNQDDDVAGFIINPTSGLITREDGLQAFFTVALDTQPTANVSLTLQSNDTTEGTISPTSLTFTPANWDTPQTVTITGKNDFIHDGNIPYKILTNPATSADPNYTGVDAVDVSVTNSDDDTPGFVISPGKDESEPLLTSEGQASAIINILLNTEPTANVVFTFTSQDTSEGVFSLDNPGLPKTVTFTPTDWNVLQSIQLIGVDDTEVDGDFSYTVDVHSSSADVDYNAKSLGLLAINKDAPTIEWSLPVNHDPYYETCSLNPILLGVKKVGSEPISLVHFYRWDDKLKQTISVGDDDSAPYRVYLDPQILNYQWNQIYAYAVDNESDQTQSIHVPLLIYRSACLYLPTVNK